MALFTVYVGHHVQDPGLGMGLLEELQELHARLQLSLVSVRAGAVGRPGCNGHHYTCRLGFRVGQPGLHFSTCWCLQESE